MSFLDTLKSLGLWQGAPGGQQPYGMDPALVQQARMASLGNIGSQLLAASIKQTAGSRANVLANADWTGGYQGNLYNAMQMQQAAQQQKQAQIELQRKEEARKMIADRIKAAPPGRLRDAAMYFFQAGDLGKAGELLFSQSTRFNAATGEYENVDAMGNPIDGPVTSSGGVPLPSSGSSKKGGKMKGVAPVPPAAGGDAGVDQLTANWRRLTGDPELTPQEAQQIAIEAGTKNDPAAGLTLYREIRKQRQADANAQAGQDQTALQNNRSAAQQLTSDYAAGTKSYDTIIQNGQLAAHVAGQLQATGKISAADKLATLYQFMKTLDPEGAVRDGDVAMAQSIQSYLSQWGQTISSAINGGGNISDAVFLEMARSMARMANEAAGRKETRRLQMIRTADGRQIPREMVAPSDGSRMQNMPYIGSGIPQEVPSPGAAQVKLPASDEDLIRKYGGN